MANDAVKISIDGGPSNPVAWRKWNEDGVQTLVDVLTMSLVHRKHYGHYSLRGIQGKKGNSKAEGFVNIREISPNDNAIVIEAQPGSAMSRWRYKLYVPLILDVVTVHRDLEQEIITKVEEEDDDEPVQEVASGLAMNGHTVVGLEPVTVPVETVVHEPIGEVSVAPVPDRTEEFFDETAILKVIRMATEYKNAKDLLDTRDPNQPQSLRQQMTEVEQEIMALETRIKNLLQRAAALKSEAEAINGRYSQAEEIATNPCHAAAFEKALSMNAIAKG